MKKIGLISLALVLAVGGLGIGYAAWTDTLYIDGTVNTGTVDINIEALSGTWVWKVDHTPVQHHGWGTTLGGPDAGPALPLADVIASATAEMDVTDPDGDTVIVTFDNLYPCKWLFVDFLVHYDGTIPARLDVEWEADDALMALLDTGHIGVEAYVYDPVDPANPKVGGMGNIVGGPIIEFCGFQVHECDYILIKIWIHIPQEYPDGTSTQDALSGQTFTFSADLTAVQWNEYPLP